MTEAKKSVYQAIAAVQGELAKTGISKDGRNEQQRYMFRGIDQVYNALAPLLAKHGLCILPRVLSRETTERQTKSGTTLFYVNVDVEFDFVSASDSSIHTVRTQGEAMDSGDKATNKAMSAAYKYAAFMAFAIPTEGDNDADATTHDVAPRQESALITDAQRQELMALALPKNIDAKTICELGKLASIKDMPAAMFDEAKAWITRQKKRELGQSDSAKASDILADEIPY